MYTTVQGIKSPFRGGAARCVFPFKKFKGVAFTPRGLEIVVDFRRDLMSLSNNMENDFQIF